MASFRYKALTASGSTLSGVLEAPSAAEVIAQLRAQGHYPLSTTAGGRAKTLDSLRNAIGARTAPSLRNLAVLTRELGSLLTAGLELDRSLAIIADLETIDEQNVPLNSVRKNVRAGLSLSDALSREGKFPSFYIGMVRVGEMGGTLARSLGNVSGYLTRALAIREAVLSALLYPVILLLTSGVSISIILFFVLPEFKPLFEDASQALPWPARLLMGLSDFLRGWWWLLAVIITAATFWLRQKFRSPSLRLRFDAWLLNVPLLGSLLQAIDTERLCRVLSMLLAGGVALPTALLSARDVLQNRKIGEAVTQTATRLREGESLAARLARTGVFARVTTDLIAIGEESGKLGDMLMRQADAEEERIRHVIDRLLALLVPALTLVMGVIVAALIASLMSAILSLNQLALK